MKIINHIIFLITILSFAVRPAFLYSQVIATNPSPIVITADSELRQPCHDRAMSNVPTIAAMVGEVNADTMHKTMQQLQDFGSRFALKENRKEIAVWLKDKFLSYGFTDVKLDSFYGVANYYIYHDTTLQYNVICTLPGTSPTNELFVIGAHYDSYCTNDPYNNAPGADDNGSGTSATLEIARVMAKLNYHPQTMIQFTLFAAEELGKLGSLHAAQKERLKGTDIRVMYAMDMISNNPANLNEMVAFDYPGHEWAAVAAAEAIKRYTDMPVVVNKYFGPGITLREGTDSYSYWLEGFPALGFWETELSPYYHTPADSVGICNIPYLAKVTGGILAALAEQDILPSPQNLTAHSSKEEISLQWKATHTAHIRGFNVFRSETSGAQYQKLTQIPVSDTVYHDMFAAPNTEYFYVLTVVNDSLQESGFSEEVSGARFNFNDTLLVLASLAGTEITPDSVYAFYDAALDTIPYKWYDINATFKVDPGLLSRHRSVLWMTNTSSFEVPDIKTKQSVSDFISSGGNLLFAGFNPMRFWMNTPPNKFALKIPETELFCQLFKVDSVTRKIQSFLHRANAVEEGYDTLNVDVLKYVNLSYPGQISNVDAFTPTENGRVIYRFDSKFDSATSLGRLKNHPVGIEYMGPDFKSILLSFPLYYMDTSDVKNFFHYAVTQKFNHTIGVEPIASLKPFDLCIYPNPVSDVLFINNWNRDTRFSIFDVKGRIMVQNSNDNKIDVSHYPAGVYLIRIITQSGKPVCSGKFVKD